MVRLWCVKETSCEEMFYSLCCLNSFADHQEFAKSSACSSVVGGSALSSTRSVLVSVGTEKFACMT
jgi:hypothetical protein